MRKHLFIILMLAFNGSFTQSIPARLSLAVSALEADAQCRHGIIGLYVLEDKSNQVVFSKNAETGLAPASCQKIITSAAAFALLGKDYTYRTAIGYTGKINNGVLSGDIVIMGSGDPTLGSWRYKSTKEEVVISDFKGAIINAGIKQLRGRVISRNDSWDSRSIPDGWIWQDIGNYYGAGAAVLNWRENQYDLILRSGGRVGDPVNITGTIPPVIPGVRLINRITSAEKGSGDNAYIYLPAGSIAGQATGTIPVNQDHFIISGAMPNGAAQLIHTLTGELGFNFPDSGGIPALQAKSPASIIFTHNSPPLDSINYLFLKKSINLYGEALVKTIAYTYANFGSTDTGIAILKDFWAKRGIEPAALNIIDGSGLSPANRITASSLATALQFAKRQKWFSSFYYALPEINGIKMKSGLISGVLSYAGYIKNRAGNEYTFAFIVNNYNGSGSSLREKMWKILDILK